MHHSPLPAQLAPQDVKRLFDTLTPTQRRVCLLMAEGLMNKQIAEQLGCSINTVKTHRAEIFHKMTTRSLLELARMVDLLRHGEFAQDFRPLTAASTGLTDQRGAEQVRVLIVEDNRDLRESLVSIRRACAGALTRSVGIHGHPPGFVACIRHRICRLISSLGRRLPGTGGPSLGPRAPGGDHPGDRLPRPGEFSDRS